MTEREGLYQTKMFIIRVAELGNCRFADSGWQVMSFICRIL